MKNEKKGGHKRSARNSGVRPPRGGGGGEGNPFEDFLEDFADDPDQPLKFLRAFMAGEDAYNPAVDVVEEAERLVLIADLPGVTERDLKIEFVEGGVILRGRREAAPEGNGSKLRRAERPAGDFSKSVPLPRGLDTRRANVKIENGVLTLTIPRGGESSTEDGVAAPRALKSGREP